MIKKQHSIFGVKLDLYSQAAVFCLMLVVITGLSSNIIATSRPLHFRFKNNSYFPAFSHQIDKEYYKDQKAMIEWNPNCSGFSLTEVYAPVPYSPGQSDMGSTNFKPPLSKYKPTNNLTTDYYCSPNQFRHWLGTNLKGEDLLSGLIHGTSVSLKIGFFSILIALIIGVFLGVIAGYFQNDTWKVPILSLVFMLGSILPSIYMANLFSFFISEKFAWEGTFLLLGTLGIYLVTILLFTTGFLWMGKFIHWVMRWKKEMHVPLDTIASRFIEIFAAVPKLMLVVALAAILERSVTNVILVIGISSWAGIARIVRAETMKIRNQDFITSAKALGLTNMNIILKHVLPNIAGPILVVFVFGLSAAILIESGLSFLNIGVPENTITWGQLLADGKSNFNAWWLIVFPGFAIFITVLCLNILGEKFKSLLDPLNRNVS